MEPVIAGSNPVVTEPDPDASGSPQATLKASAVKLLSRSHEGFCVLADDERRNMTNPQCERVVVSAKKAGRGNWPIVGGRAAWFKGHHAGENFATQCNGKRFETEKWSQLSGP